MVSAEQPADTSVMASNVGRLGLFHLTQAYVYMSSAEWPDIIQGLVLDGLTPRSILN